MIYRYSARPDFEADDAVCIVYAVRPIPLFNDINNYNRLIDYKCEDKQHFPHGGKAKETK